MANEDKGVENIMKIKRIAGFYIKLPGDMSVGIPDSEWKLDGDFYFDNADELEEFRAKLKLTFEDYCGENCRVETFEEQQMEIDEELQQL
jgi:hypothetical protein